MNGLGQVDIQNISFFADLFANSLGNPSSPVDTDFREVIEGLVSSSENKKAIEDEMLAIFDSPVMYLLVAKLDEFLSSLHGMSSSEKEEFLQEIIRQIAGFIASGQVDTLTQFLERMFEAQSKEDASGVIREFFARQEMPSFAVQKEAFLVAHTEEAVPSGEGDVSQAILKALQQVVAEGETATSPVVADKAELEEKIMQALSRVFSEKGVEKTAVGNLPASSQELEDSFFLGLSLKSTPVVQEGGLTPEANAVEQEAKIDFINLVKEMVSRFELQSKPTTWQSVLELSSVYLGNTKVRVEMNGTRMLLDILVARLESKELITHSIQELKSALEEQGISLDECAVDVDQNLSFGKAFVPHEGGSARTQEDAYDDLSTSQATAEKGRVSGEKLVLGQEQINCFA